MIFAVNAMAYLVFLIGALIVGLHLWTRKLAQDALRAVPQAGRLHPVTGGAIHYVEMGPKDGQPLVLIHGLSAQLQHFTYGITEHLSDTYRIIALDRPGSGYSRRDDDGMAALDIQARMIWQMLDDLGVQHPVIAGHSLGGAVALAMALQRPDDTGALALISPLTHGADGPADVFKGLLVASPTVRRLIGQTIATPMAKLMTDKILTEAFSPEIYPPDFLDRAGAALGLRPEGYISASADIVASGRSIHTQMTRYANELRAPGGVLYGAGDTVLSADREGRVMENYGLSYEELPNRGHMIPISAPADCADFIRRMAALVR